MLWFTGLSASGKSTVAAALEAALLAAGHAAYVLDGDAVRHGLNSDLGFAPADRTENIRRIGEVAALFADAGMLALTAFISPYRADRHAARVAVGEERFLEIFLSTPLDVCEQRDPKQLYRRARAGEIEDFTGVSAPYEPPESPALDLDTSVLDLDACVGRLVAMLWRRGFLFADSSSAGPGAIGA